MQCIVSYGSIVNALRHLAIKMSALIVLAGQ